MSRAAWTRVFGSLVTGGTVLCLVTPTCPSAPAATDAVVEV